MRNSVDGVRNSTESNDVTSSAVMRDLEAISDKEIAESIDKADPICKIQDLAGKILEIFEADNQGKPLNERTYLQRLRNVTSGGSQRDENIKTLLRWFVYIQERDGGGNTLEELKDASQGIWAKIKRNEAGDRTERNAVVQLAYFNIIPELTGDEKSLLLKSLGLPNGKVIDLATWKAKVAPVMVSWAKEGRYPFDGNDIKKGSEQYRLRHKIRMFFEHAEGARFGVRPEIANSLADPSFTAKSINHHTTTLTYTSGEKLRDALRYDYIGNLAKNEQNPKNERGPKDRDRWFSYDIPIKEKRSQIRKELKAMGDFLRTHDPFDSKTILMRSTLLGLRASDDMRDSPHNVKLKMLQLVEDGKLPRLPDSSSDTFTQK